MLADILERHVPQTDSGMACTDSSMIVTSGPHGQGTAHLLLARVTLLLRDVTDKHKLTDTLVLCAIFFLQNLVHLRGESSGHFEENSMPEWTDIQHTRQICNMSQFSHQTGLCKRDPCTSVQAQQQCMLQPQRCLCHDSSLIPCQACQGKYSPVHAPAIAPSARPRLCWGMRSMPELPGLCSFHSLRFRRRPW